MKDVRIYWLNELLRTRFDGERRRLQDASGLTKGRISQMLSAGFSDTAVDNLLEALAANGHRLPDDYFNRPIPPKTTFATASTARQSIPVAEAFEVFVRAVSELKPEKRRRVLDATAAYASDMENELDERDYVLRVLSGELPVDRPRRKAVNE